MQYLAGKNLVGKSSYTATHSDTTLHIAAQLPYIHCEFIYCICLDKKEAVSVTFDTASFLFAQHGHTLTGASP